VARAKIEDTLWLPTELARSEMNGAIKIPCLSLVLKAEALFIRKF
jgi:hypothetical protein